MPSDMSEDLGRREEELLLAEVASVASPRALRLLWELAGPRCVGSPLGLPIGRPFVGRPSFVGRPRGSRLAASLGRLVGAQLRERDDEGGAALAAARVPLHVRAIPRRVGCLGARRRPAEPRREEGPALARVERSAERASRGDLLLQGVRRALLHVRLALSPPCRAAPPCRRAQDEERGELRARHRSQAVPRRRGQEELGEPFGERLAVQAGQAARLALRARHLTERHQRRGVEAAAKPRRQVGKRRLAACLRQPRP
mmetsp:Transcript_48025/g.155316  ORF Transcript_48025/g.155316 Transcript_48025/m.155316 type:complete len:257 (-) Transcript_48025:641-1411(-)